jgi:acyl-coenzyme A thioesterase PaaI-like protein
LRGGKQIVIAEAEIFDVDGKDEKLIAKLTETLAVIEPRD